MNPKKAIKRGWISRLPVWFKVCFLKFWFAGAVLYFVGWGMQLSSIDQLDLTVALGLVLGLVTDLMVNRIFVFLESDTQEYRPYMMAYSKKFLSIPINLVYGVIIAFLISYTYHFINYAAQILRDAPAGTIVLGVEPLLYGLLFLGFDMLFIGIKNLCKSIFKRARQGADAAMAEHSQE